MVVAVVLNGGRLHDRRDRIGVNQIEALAIAGPLVVSGSSRQAEGGGQHTDVVAFQGLRARKVRGGARPDITTRNFRKPAA